ncbi:DUF3617 domain-containing protein [Aurantiacibacter sp. MUD11]|uniref:DUF3617 domain-containing protein n=1 Tax=Aurantiacibacter sp. MUD11 TaxID=3003265 RepID=UPI0022AA29A6|nr:DUF3617 domain-containing protein [Aurantiacibacter sp. MUD11]WAT17845.1 DUF3617 domain-containing protein [Aurantiacibacter sp. MUD11]
MRKIVIGIAALGIAASAAAIEPGNWEATSRMVDIELPDSIPAETAGMVRQMLGDRTFTSTTCVTADQIQNAPENLFRETNGDCQYSEFDMSGGTLHAVAQCNTEEGTMTMTMDGTYTDTTYDMTMAMRGDMGMGPMTMNYAVTGRRVGTCN